MAAYKGSNKTKQDAIPSVKLAPGEAVGGGFIAYDEYVPAAALVAADTIALSCKIPAGARIYEIIASVPTGGGTVDIGVAGTPAKYQAAAAAGTVTVARPLSVPTTDEELLATIGGAPASVGTYKFAVRYSKY